MQTQVTNIGTFVGGLNTEQPQLADQIQFTVDELNCQLLPDGTRARRYGISSEENSLGLPASYIVTQDWNKVSAELSQQLSENNTNIVDTFMFDLSIVEWGSACTAVPFIEDGDDTTYKWVFEAVQESSLVEWHLQLIKNNVILFNNVLQNSGALSEYTHFRIKVEPYAQDTTKMICKLFGVDSEDTEHAINASLLNDISNFAFTNNISVLNSEFTTDGAGAFTISNIKFTKDGVKVVGSTDTGESSYGFLIEYAPTEDMTDEIANNNGVKEYTITLPEAGNYTITMVGAGCYEGPTWSGYNNVYGSAGAGIIFSSYLEAGEYTVKVGYFYPFSRRINRGTIGGITTLNMATLRDGGETSIYRENVIDIKAGGGYYSGYGNTYYWSKSGGAQGSVSPAACSGILTLNTTPSVFNIINRSTDSVPRSSTSPAQVSFLTNDSSGAGAPSRNGYFKITKGTTEDVTETIKDATYGAYYWSNFDKKGSDCIVLQQGTLLRFFKAERPYDSVEIARVETKTQVKSEDFSKYSFSSGEGFLLAVSEYAEPFYVTLNADDEQATITPITLKIRDLTGLDDNLSVDTYPSTLTDEHKYNLLNQGWDTTKITAYYTSQSKYPSNALIWWLGKDNNGDFSATNLSKVYFGSTLAPKGHYILEYFNQDRADASSISGLKTVTRDRYVADAAFFAGRFFYLTSSTVLFSQVIREDIRNIGKCYQDADPTSQHISDIVATDGGEIIFQELGYGKAIKKYPLGLLVFGTKSVYSIQSTAGNTFTATQYQSQFVTHAGAISGESVVNVEDAVWYWSPQGIYQIVVDQVSGTQAIAQSVSAGTIQTWYNNLPQYSKENCIGAYDYTNRRIVWIYPTNENDLGNRDGVLAYYLDFKAFLPSKISESGKLLTVFETTQPTFIIPSIGLFADDDEIVAGATDVTVKEFGAEYGRNFSVCYLGYIERDDRIYFCDFSSRDFIDWDISLYNSFALSYPITFGNTFAKKYTPVAQCYFLRTEEDELDNNKFLTPSSCYVRARWKWGENSDSHKWDLTQEGYIRIPRFMNFRYVNGKIRIKGSGPSMQLMLESKEDNDFKLSGINLEIRTM